MLPFELLVELPSELLAELPSELPSELLAETLAEFIAEFPSLRSGAFGLMSFDEKDIRQHQQFDGNGQGFAPISLHKNIHGNSQFLILILPH